MFDGSLIREHIDVVGSDGQHVGKQSDPAAGRQHHYISLAMVERITADTVRLAQTADETRKTWH